MKPDMAEVVSIQNPGGMLKTNTGDLPFDDTYLEPITYAVLFGAIGIQGICFAHDIYQLNRTRNAGTLTHEVYVTEVKRKIVEKIFLGTGTFIGYRVGVRESKYYGLIGGLCGGAIGLGISKLYR